MPPRYTGLPCFFGVPPIAAGCTSPLALPFGIPPSSFIFRKLREARFRVYRIKYSFCRIWGIYKLCTLLQRSNLKHTVLNLKHIVLVQTSNVQHLHNSIQRMFLIRVPNSIQHVRVQHVLNTSQNICRREPSIIICD